MAGTRRANAARGMENGVDRNESSHRNAKGFPRWKRPLDLLLIVLSLPLTAPLLALIAAMIKVVSRGPVFYRQPRIGYREKPFTCLKFRTMRTDVNTQI